MTWYTPRDEILFSGGEIWDAFGGGGSIGPGPGREFVYEVVAGEEELLGGDLAGGAEGGGVGDRGPAVAEGIECGMEEVHG